MPNDETPEDVPAPPNPANNGANQGNGSNEEPQPNPAGAAGTSNGQPGATAPPSGRRGKAKNKTNRNREPSESDDDEEENQFNESNPFFNCDAREIKSAYNHATRIYGKNSKKFGPYEPHLEQPFCPEIGGELLQLQRNLIHYFSTMENASVALWSKFNDDLLYNKVAALQDLQADMVIQIEQYLESNHQAENESDNEDNMGDIIPRAPKKRIGIPKPVAAFKPKELSKDATPEEFETWKDNFEVYFEASNAHNCSLKTQAVFLFTCIDPHLVSMLKKRSGAEIPTLSSDTDTVSYMFLIEQYFKKKYPLHVRRAEFLAFKPTQGMKSSEFFVQAIQKMNDAEIMNTPVHDIITSFLAHNCPDTTLRMELLRADFLSIQTIVNKALTFEMAKVQEPGEGIYATGQRRRTQYQNRKPGNQGRGQQNKPQNSPKNCQSCGSDKHVRKDCPHREKTCDFCKIKGHLQNVCRKKLGIKNNITTTSQHHNIT